MRLNILLIFSCLVHCDWVMSCVYRHASTIYSHQNPYHIYPDHVSRELWSSSRLGLYWGGLQRGLGGWKGIRTKKNQLSVHHNDLSFASLSVKEKPPFLFFSQALIRFGVDVAMITEGDEVIHTYYISNVNLQCNNINNMLDVWCRTIRTKLALSLTQPADPCSLLSRTIPRTELQVHCGAVTL